MNARLFAVVLALVWSISSAIDVSHASWSGDRPLRCPCRLDCGCSLAKEFDVTDKAKARRLWVARNWLHEFPRAQPGSGTAVVLSRGRRGKGHVGKFKGFDENGNPIVESFKCRGSIGEHVYPRTRVLGYVRP